MWILLGWVYGWGCGDAAGPSGSAGETSSAASSTTEGIGSTARGDDPSPTTGPATGDGTDTGPATAATTGGAIYDVGGVGDLGATGPACTSDLSQVIDPTTGVVLRTCPPDQGCFEGQCIPACAAASAAQGSVGCEFVVPTSPFFGNGTPGAVQSGPCHALLVANPWGRAADLQLWRDGVQLDLPLVTRVPTGIASATVYDPLPASGVPTDEVAVVFLSHRPGVHNGNSLECPVPPAVLGDTAVHGTGTGTAFELSSDTPIQVYDIIPYGGAPTYLPSASLLLPTSAWGHDYVVVTPHEPDGTLWLSAVAGLDDTTVSLLSTVGMQPGTLADPPVGVVTQTTIDAGQVLQWHGLGDPSGTIITADKPIGVLGGNTYLSVPSLDAPDHGRDSAHQMLPPVGALSAEHVAAGIVSRLPGAMPESVPYRIMGVVDGTTLHWDPAPPAGAPASLDAGQVVQLESRDAFVVTATDDAHPFVLSQYMPGTHESPGCLGSPQPCLLGDDSWVVLVPPQQYLRSYAFFVDPTYGTSTLVVVRQAGSTGFSDVILQCMGPIGGWQPIDDGGRFEYAHVQLYRGGVGTSAACETSQHRAWSDEDFGIVVWGTDFAAAYGYPAGGALRTINEVDVVPAP
ncbi:MAG: IgGFc-binding protein [Nannocystaceae bacterium]